jgi:tripartite-type tricarboxylate transporter receptor subunit TctC
VAVTSLKRTGLLPEVPTGYPGYEVIGIHGLLAPAGTPRLVVGGLYAAPFGYSANAPPNSSSPSS